MNKLEKTPVTIVTGFLGSGKTTLIKHLLQNANGKRLAVLVNEFGSVGVDGEILKKCGDENCPAENILELANGCICCTVADDFIPTIETLMELPKRPDHILIETSGLALPKPLLKAFDWPAIKSQITVDGVVAVADCEAVASGRYASNVDAVNEQRLADESLDHESPLAEVFEDQIACADIVLLSKADVVDEQTIEKASQIVLEHAPRKLPTLPITEGRIDPRLVLDLDAEAENDLNNRPSHHENHHHHHDHDHDHDHFETIVVDMAEIEDVADLETRVKRLASELDILRVKGYVSVKGKPMKYLVQAVGERVRAQYTDLWGDAPRKSALVVIGEHHRINKDKIEAILCSA